MQFDQHGQGRTADLYILPEDGDEGDFVVQYLEDLSIEYDWQVETRPTNSWYAQAAIKVPFCAYLASQIEAAYNSYKSGPQRVYY